MKSCPNYCYLDEYCYLNLADLENDRKCCKFAMLSCDSEHESVQIADEGAFDQDTGVVHASVTNRVRLSHRASAQTHVLVGEGR